MAHHSPNQSAHQAWQKKTLDSIPLEYIDFFALSNLALYFSHPQLTLKELQSQYKHNQTYDVFEGEQHRARVELRYGFGSRAAREEEYSHALEVQLAVWSEDEKLSRFLLREIPRLAARVENVPHSPAERAGRPMIAATTKGVYYG